jgi:hypothetical protein
VSDESTPPKTPDPVAELREQLEKVRAETESERSHLKEKLGEFTGQLQVLSAAASEPLQPPAEQPTPPDIITETDKALDFHFQKRTRPLIQQQLQREAARERELLSVKREADWKKFGPQVDQLIAQNRIPVETLSTPGAYDQLLDLVKAKNIDAIVKEKVEAEVASWREAQAKAAGAGPNAAQASPSEKPKNPEELLSDEERRIAQKLGVDPKKYAETAAKVVFDGVRYRGEVAH